jgi:carbamoyl-phosphate synthase large subunit
MKKYTVLVTGVGALIGYGVIRSLRRCRYDVTIVGMDVYDDAVGQQWCDTFTRAVWASDDGYCDFLSSLISQYNIDLVFFGLEPEIHKLFDSKHSFKGDSGKLVLNKKELIDLSKDKWRMFEYLTANQFPAIKTMISGEYDLAAQELGLPCLLKPRYSSASKGIMEIYSREDFHYWKNKLGKDFMVQEIVGDDEHEYTVGLFGLGDGSLSQSITFKRKLSREGATVKAQTVDIPELDEEVIKLTSLFKPVGPTNYQFRLHNGNFLLLEVNPRISSSTSLRTAFGFNEAEMSIQFFAENKKPHPAALTRGTAIRYIEDIVNYS